ncbi:hypothetical protein PHMEG_00025494 [Phytophthora megakarya]|uniref:Plastocyanin-like domain-containing protein n=1 Tax=Phytophthora megakarya TaxID=4795 RepID=A0A225VC08_9STRA|nr:hypothetical protein PHMEG_00025494 [Phytophthora megakarya]
MDMFIFFTGGRLCGSTALEGAVIHAARSGYLEIVELLDKLGIRKVLGDAIKKAVEGGHLNVMKWLYNHVKNPPQQLELVTSAMALSPVITRSITGILRSCNGFTKITMSVVPKAQGIVQQFMASVVKTFSRKTWPTDLEIVVDDAYVPMNDTSFLTVYVNGQCLPSEDLNVGEYKRLRFVNAIVNNLVELVVTKGSKCTIDLLTMDGIYLDEPKSKTVVVVPAGGRADDAIMCAEIGELNLETDSARSRNKVLSMVNQFRVPSQRIWQHPSLPARPSYMENIVGDVSTVIRETNRYSYEFSMWTDSASDMMELGVNREKFNMSYVNHSMPVGELQEWDISVNEYEPWSPCYLDSSSTNTDCYTMVYPFHIHATHFQIFGMDDHADPENVLYSVGEWRDTIPMFRSNVQIRFMPREYIVGNIVTHCHIASHADWGVAQLVNVYKPRSVASDEGTNTDKDENIGEQGKQ